VLRVGIWITPDIIPQIGGEFGYYSALLDGIKNYSFSSAKIVFIGTNIPDSLNIGKYRVANIKSKKHIKKIFRVIRMVNIKTLNIKYITNLLNKVESSVHNKLKNELKSYCDIIYYIRPMCFYENFPYIYTIWDIGFYSTYPFPELAGGQIYDFRKNLYNRQLHKALFVFAESEAGKLSIIKHLGVYNEKIKVLPLIPSNIIDNTIQPVMPKELKNIKLFIHYPAQFWAHKNHRNLLLALKIVKDIFPDIKLILTGSEKRNGSYIEEVISSNELTKYIINLGFIDITELKWLYQNSSGLVMPTFLGPTNMPLIEAAHFSCPVACSNLEGHIEQLGDYAYYFDPKDFKDIAAKIILMINSSTIPKPPKSLPCIANNLQLLDQYFSEISTVRLTWS
jgi:glycosyltransferase involved in cell wall biosynthesis